MKKLYVEQLIAGALLKFERFSSLDISLLSEDFLKKYPDFKLIDGKMDFLGDYVEAKDGVITLKSKLNLDSYIPENASKLRTRIEQIADVQINKYFQEFNIESFMLRKIEECCGVEEDSIDSIFCKTQQEELKKLDEKGYLTTTWEDDVIYDDYRVIRLSDFGKLRLFKVDNAKEISRFIEMLKSMRVDTNLLDDFLLKQDLCMPVWSVLDIEKLEQFCESYDRAITEENVSSVIFKRLQSDENTILDDSGRELMECMLSVWKNDCIHICHPNHIFNGAKPLTADVREIANINWNDVDIEKMLKMNDYKTFITPDWSEAFKYVHKRLGHQIMSEINKGNEDEAVSYLVVVEENVFDNDQNCIVRGIIRGDSDGYSIAFNPQYQKIMPSSMWEKSLMMGDNEYQVARLVKMPNL